MKHTGMKFSAIHLSGNGGLYTFPPYEESIEGIKKLINEANARAKAKGYAEESFLICMEVWINKFNDNDEFEGSEHYINVMEKYPANI